MNALMKGIKNFAREEEGVTMIEYGLLAALIAVVCIGVITTVGTDIKSVFTKVSTGLTTAAATPTTP